ncbi:MAG: threonylcarbamoyl-AMP synthase [bacterium]|nr:threonylcarbamoyl-AMP synthase [bacterium]
MVDVVTICNEEDYASSGARVIDVLAKGGVVAFPTETVYGVGARADRPDAVARLRRLKGRTDGRPFTVHIPAPESLERYVPEPSALGRRLAHRGWPGPLTLLFRVDEPGTVLERAGWDASLADEVYAGEEIGLRCPDHEFTRRILAGVDGPVVAASANRAGGSPAGDAAGAIAALGDDLDLVVDGGPARYQEASTVVRVGDGGFEVLRVGVHDERSVRRMASMSFLFVCTGNTCRSPMAAGMFQQMLARRLGCAPEGLAERHITVLSAGTLAGSGAPAAPEGIEVMRRRDVDISRHRSSRLSPELLNQADHIYAMTRSHAGAVKALVPSAGVRTHLLSGDGDIGDPIGGGVEVYAECAATIEKALNVRLAEVEL